MDISAQLSTVSLVSVGRGQKRAAICMIQDAVKSFITIYRCEIIILELSMSSMSCRLAKPIRVPRRHSVSSLYTNPQHKFYRYCYKQDSLHSVCFKNSVLDSPLNCRRMLMDCFAACPQWDCQHICSGKMRSSCINILSLCLTWLMYVPLRFVVRTHNIPFHTGRQ